MRTSATSRATCSGAPTAFATFATTAAAASCSTAVTAGTPTLRMPAFSAAIAVCVLPNNSA